MFLPAAEDRMRFPRVCGLIATLLLSNLPGAAAAGHRPHHGAPPSLDAVQLAGIAPLTRRGTALQDYGDAEIARVAMQRRILREEAKNVEMERTGGTPHLCDRRLATVDAYVCRNNPRVTGYAQGFAFTPSYVSAPTVFEQNPDAQEPIMPDITGFFWLVNSARIDPH